MAGNDPGAALSAIFRDGQIEDVIQATNNSLNAAVVLQIDEWVTDRRKNIARGDHFRMTEVHNAVAIGIGVRLVIKNHGLAIEVLRQLVKIIKDTGKKVQPSIMDEQVRVSGKKIDDLQEIISILEKAQVGVPLQFENFRG